MKLYMIPDSNVSDNAAQLNSLYGDVPHILYLIIKNALKNVVLSN